MTDEENKKMDTYNQGFKAGENHNIFASKETRLFMKNMENEIKEIKKTLETLPTKTEMELANQNLVKEVLKSVKDDYVSIERFKPVEKLAYGLSGAGLVTIFYGLFKLVIK